MDNGWVKLYRKLATNDVMYDQKALQVFVWLLLHVDKKTGEFRTGRFIIAGSLKLNPNTVYNVLQRLEKKYLIINNKTNNKYSTISLLNWAKYQVPPLLSTQAVNNKSTTNQQQINTIQEVRIENREITKVIVKQGNEDINQLVEYFKQRMEIPKEDCSIKQSRQYWHLLLKESKSGIEGVKWLIDLAKTDEFYSNNITSSKSLYYSRVKLITRQRGNKPKIAVFGGGNNE